jgi:hypothetical protein
MNCSKNAYTDPTPPTPDTSSYEVEDVVEVGSHIVMKVHYPNCARCSYEGMKIMVFCNVGLADVVRWKKIDPHFRNRSDQRGGKAREAPSPAARFPGDPEGWADAISYAQHKGRDH